VTRNARDNPTCNTKGNLRCRARATTATIALIAGGYLVMSGTAADAKDLVKAGGTAEPAAAESSSWLGDLWAAVWPSTDNAADTPSKADRKKSGNAEAKEGKKVDRTRKEDLFRPGPEYDKKYDPKVNVDIYGAKTAVEAPRAIEVGREQYTSGLYDKSNSILGELNLLAPGLSIYGDWRTAVAYNSNAGKDIAQIATRLNIDVDLKFTATERIHAFFTPLQKNNAFTRFEFGGGDGDKKFNDEFDLKPQTLFFEGDLGSILSGATGKPSNFDLPFTVGLFPLFLQNGIWANDAILGGAVSLTAKNSRKLGLSNYDVTFFAAFDNVDNAGILGKDNRNANLYGVTTFIDAFGGYIEAGYGLIQGVENRVVQLFPDVPGAQNLTAGQLTHFFAAAYTRRYFNTLSNTTRVFANTGNGKNDDGVVVISENSLISGLPSTLLPYANFFVGVGNPQPLVDGNGAGILKNVGINFETDALTGFPKLNDSGSNAWGGAVGIQYLFNLDQQLVFEVATVQPFGSPLLGIGALKPQYGFGTRYQIPINAAWLFRADATYHLLGGGQDSFGLRTEIRRKF
jgi:hypothetical protein